MELVIPNLELELELINSCDKCLNDSISEHMPHGGTYLEGAKHGHRRDSRARQFGSHVIGNPGETDHLYMQHLAGGGCLKVGARVVLQS